MLSMRNLKFGQPIAIALLLSVIAVPTHAQDVDSGRAIAEHWCSACHLVGRTQTLAPNDAIPTFRSIADMNSTTAISLTVFLQSSHEPMPNLMLSRRQIADVSAYILSLRAPDRQTH